MTPSIFELLLKLSTTMDKHCNVGARVLLETVLSKNGTNE
jgi:hypothetical protein